MRVLFLYTELADYFIKCCARLSLHAEVHIVRWPVNKEAPFDFSFPPGITVYDKKNYTRDKLSLLVKNINPNIIVCSGWIDKDYLAVVKPFFKKIPTVLTCDTHWRNSLKQRIAVLLSPFFLLNRFSHAWVPGETQAAYCRNLGFKNIKKGFYCCDLDFFNQVYQKHFHLKEQDFPKKFLFVGRYYEFKGIKDLWDAFIELQNQSPNDWELWCLGAGTVEPVSHPGIKHFGFVQPSEIHKILPQCGVFILPSRFEPWGVVVQEYAAAGFPILVSNKVGAAEAFLKSGENGFLFEAGNVESILDTLKKISGLDNKALNLMSQRSHSAAQAITPDQWVATLTDFYYEFRES